MRKIDEFDLQLKLIEVHEPNQEAVLKQCSVTRSRRGSSFVGKGFVIRVRFVFVGTFGKFLHIRNEPLNTRKNVHCALKIFCSK